jgi:hypothetical protein
MESADASSRRLEACDFIEAEKMRHGGRSGVIEGRE